MQGDLHAITDFDFSEPFEQFPGAVVLDNNLVLQNPYGEIDCICFQELTEKRSTLFIIFMLCKYIVSYHNVIYINGMFRIKPHVLSAWQLLSLERFQSKISLGTKISLLQKIERLKISKKKSQFRFKSMT